MTAGGKERRLTELMKGLKKMPDVEFSLVLMTHDIHYEEVLKLGIDIHFFIRKRKKDASIFRSYYRLCKSYKPDIVHCWDTMTAIYITPVCKLLNLKLVNGMIVDSPKRHDWLFQPWIRARITFPFADLIIGNSKAGLLAYSAPEKKSLVIYNGFNFDRTSCLISANSIREKYNINTRFIVGMVATFSGFKDYATYFKAAHIVLRRRKDVTFLAIGKDTDSENSRNLLANECFEHFRLLGKKSDIESYVSTFDIGVLSTFTEGISNSILEYMALGKPVIATSGGGTNEIVVNQETGFLISQSNPDELAERIMFLLDNPLLCAEMGRLGKIRIKDEFSIEGMIDKYYSAYNMLLGK
jgi:glycosyltransferase involved in cell wall biosynthesis